MSSALKRPLVSDPIAELCAEVQNATAVQLGENQRSMAEARIQKWLMSRGFETAQEYVDYFRLHKDSELPHLISLLTTHHTYFFREFAQFEFISSKLLETLIQKARSRPDKTIHIWSAACSRGQEVYSLSMFFDYHLKLKAPDVTYKIVGSDVDPQSVKLAQNGVYLRHEIKEIPLNFLSDHWAKGTGQIENYVKAKPSLRDRCHFIPLNLLDISSSSLRKDFDLIFCRNVFIYFTPEEIQRITNNLIKRLDIKGCLFLGISETLNGLKVACRPIGPSIYQQIQLGETPATKNDDSRKIVPLQKLTPLTPAKILSPSLLKVFCIDDSPSIHNLLKGILDKDNGFEIIGTAENGKDAQEKLKNLKPDVITLDIHMPEMTGVEYLEKNFNLKHPPVVMLSSVSRDDSELAFRALSSGASDFVEKPALSNFKERGEELRTKLKAAIFNHLHAKDSKTLELDRSLGTQHTIKSPETKLRMIVATPSDLLKLTVLLKEIQRNDPPLYIALNCQNLVIPAFIKKLSANSSKDLNLVESSTQKLKPGEIGVLSLANSLEKIRELHQNDRTSLMVFGDVPSSSAQAILHWKGSQLLLEDLGAKKGATHLHDIATDVVPFTSFAYMSAQFLSEEKS